MQVHRPPQPKPAVLGRPVQAEPALGAELATERRHLAARVLEIVFGDLGAQGVSDVLPQEIPYLGQPRALFGVEVEIHKSAP